MEHRRRYNATDEQLLIGPALWNCLQFAKNKRIFILVPPRRFLAIAGRVTNSAKPLPVQHTGPAAIFAGRAFSFLQSPSRTTVPRRDLIRPACGATLKKSTKADH